MSFRAMRYVSELTILTPIEKLVMYQIASAHNDTTGQCNPSPERLAHFTGMSASQVRSCIMDLQRRGIIRAEGSNFNMSLPDTHGEPIPANYWPSDAAIAALVRSFPLHDFSMKEAVDAFTEYAQSEGVVASDPNQAFVRNITALLERRKPGPVTFTVGSAGGKVASVFAFLSGRG